MIGGVGNVYCKIGWFDSTKSLEYDWGVLVMCIARLDGSTLQCLWSMIGGCWSCVLHNARCELVEMVE